MSHKRALTALAPGLAILLLLSACTGPPATGRDAETAALRARVERLEQESSSERARLAADISAMREDLRALRATLEEASLSLAELSGQEGAARPDKPAPPGKSPRQALRDSLRGVMDVSREAVARLNQELDKQLAKPQRQDKPGP